MSIERQLDANHNRRMANQARAERDMDRREAQARIAAQHSVGELCRDGETIFYCFDAKGRYFESDYRPDVLDRAAGLA